MENFADEFFRFARYRVNNREAAEDLVQDTFLSGLKALGNFRGDCPEKSWLYNILRNKIIDYYRKNSSREITAGDQSQENDDAFFSRFFHSAGKSPGSWKESAAPSKWEISAHAILERKEFMNFLMLCLSMLPEMWAKVFTLKNMEDYSTKEICKELDITPSNLWTIVHRAKLQLRNCLEKHWKET